MKVSKRYLWDKKVGDCNEITEMTVYIPENKESDAAIVILPGGGYSMLADYEGDGYARFLAENGYTAFVVDYRLVPYQFPLQLLDARRAIRTVRYYADEFGIDKSKVGIMGSSAGGNLAAICSTYFEPIEFEDIDEIDKEDYIPNFQILCYPVISLSDLKITHLSSAENLLGDRLEQMGKEMSPELIISEKTPPAFIWHTFADNVVNVKNSLVYAQSLKDHSIPTELHIFPKGSHGLGLALGDDPISKHVNAWTKLLLSWLQDNNL